MHILAIIGSSDNGSTRTRHQIRYILWLQVAIFMFMWIKILCIEHILWRILTTQFMSDVANMLKNIKCKRCANKWLWASNIEACSFILFWRGGCTQSLVASCKYWVIRLKSLEFRALARSSYSWCVIHADKMSTLLHTPLWQNIFVKKITTPNMLCKHEFISVKLFENCC